MYVEQHIHNQRSWVPSRVIEPNRSVNYVVSLDLHGRQKLVRSHVNQMGSRYGSEIHGQEQQQLPWEVLLDEFGTTAAVKPVGNHISNSLSSTVPVDVPAFENPPNDLNPLITN